MNYDIVETAEGKIIVEQGGKEIDVLLADTCSGGILFNKIRESVRDDVNNELYFVCASDKIKHSLLQQATKYSFGSPHDSFAVFTMTLDKMEKGGDFEKVEFGSIQ